MGYHGPDILVVKGRHKSIFTGQTNLGLYILHEFFKISIKDTSITVETEYVDELVDEINEFDKNLIVRII